MPKETDIPRYVYFNSGNCTGCGACVKSCPTRAIRIKNGKSILLTDSCIGCGECIRVCPQGCITPAPFDPGAFKKEKLPVLFVAPVLYSQFPDARPRDVLIGLRRMGFKHIVDMTYFFEMFQWATHRFIREKTPELPVLSTMCPVVLRLVAFKYPGLFGHLNQVLRPVSIIVKEAAALIARRHRARLSDLSIFYLNPCPTKMGLEESARLKQSPYISRAIGINQIYPELKEHITDIMASDTLDFVETGFEFEQPPCGEGILWSVCGGESAGLKLDKTLSISGLDETMLYLEKTELDIFKDFSFIEFRACKEGCVGGSLCAVDKYVAKSAVRKISGRISKSRNFSREIKDRFYEQKWVPDKTTTEQMEKIFGRKKKPLSIRSLTEIDALYRRLPGYNCSACGAPDCYAFAEDVIRHRSKLKDCIFFKGGDKGDSERTCGQART
ncbi:MAG: [Fe-Fe] hydrogenase large subunit C-terminal domain-containing protein [Desulfobacteraceae bacterium]